MEYESLISNINNNKKHNFISSFIGTIIYCISISPYFGMAQFSVYITSYFHYYNSSIDMQYGNLISPILLFSLTLSSPLGGFLEKKIGMYFSLIISTILIEIFTFIFINQTSLILTFFLLVFLGLSMGFSLPIIHKNMMCFYPDKTGIISSVCMSITILVAAFVSVLGEKIINPEKIVLKENEIIYSYDLSKNYRIFYKYVLFINPIILIISLLLIKKSDTENNSQLNISNKKNDSNYIINIKAAILHKRTWGLAIFSILSTFIINFACNTFRVYGALNSFDGNIMQYCGAFIAIGMIFFGPIWGIINDNFQFNKIVKFICLYCFIHSIIITVFIKSSTIYIICIFIAPIVSSGIGTILGPHIMKVYGAKYFIEIGGVIGICKGVVTVLIGILAFIISKFYKSGKELQVAYRFIYFIGIFLCGIGIFYGLKEDDKLFVYPINEDGVNENKKKNSIYEKMGSIIIEEPKEK